MFNINTHILYICSKCGSMKIVERCEFDHEDSIFVCIDCPTEDIDGFNGNVMNYYGKNGYLGDEEKNFSSN